MIDLLSNDIRFNTVNPIDNEVDFTDKEAGHYHEVERKHVDSSCYVPSEIARGEDIHVELFNFTEQDKLSLEQHVSKEQVSELESEFQRISVIFRESTSETVTFDNRTVQSLENRVYNLQLGIMRILNILVDLLKSSGASVANANLIIENLNKISDDRAELTRSSALTRLAALDLQQKNIIDAQQANREQMKATGLIKLLLSAVTVLIVTISIVSSVYTGGASLSLIPNVVMLMSGLAALANSAVEFNCYIDNAEQHKDGHIDEIKGGFLTSWFGLDPKLVDLMSNIGSIIQTLFSVSSLGVSATNTVALANLASKGEVVVTGGLVGSEIYNGVVTVISAVNLAQDIDIAVAKIKGDKVRSEEGFLFQGLLGDDPNVHTTWLSNIMGCLLSAFSFLGSFISDIGYAIADIPADGGINANNNDKANKQFARLFLGLIANSFMMLTAAGLKTKSDWEKLDGAKDFLLVRKKFELIGAVTTVALLIQQLSAATMVIYNGLKQNYDLKLSISAKHYESYIVELEGIQHSLMTQLEEWQKIYNSRVSKIFDSSESFKTDVERFNMLLNRLITTLDHARAQH